MADPPSGDPGYTADEMMTVTAARHLYDGQVCFVGIGLPSEAANLARLSHAPDVVLIYESGTIGTRPTVLPLSIGDGELAEHADMVVGVPEVFAYWLQGGRIDVGFLSAAQIDRYGNLNTTVIGDYDHPTTRLPGAGGAPEIASAAGEVIVMLRHSPRAFVPAVDFVTSVGFGRHGEGRGGSPGSGPTVVITDLGTLAPDPVSHRLTLTATHPGVPVERVVAETGWDLEVADDLTTTEPPNPGELATLRQLKARTRQAHGTEG
ncbi:MAG: CoA-transferase subunit beta [Acidimicrobiia bacterium]|nr:CoA-transferase subunit beta [Acidimicrobiia bacterium]